MSQSTKIFVGSLPPGTKPEELRHLFENYGIVVECDVMNRCGFVHMKNAAMADSAIVALNATEFKGQTIVVEEGRPKEKKGIAGQSGRNQVQIHGRGRGAGNIVPGGSMSGSRSSRGGGSGGVNVGFPGVKFSNKAKQVATLQLAGAIMELLNETPTSTPSCGVDGNDGGNFRGETGSKRGGSVGGRGGRFGGRDDGGEDGAVAFPIRGDFSRGRGGYSLSNKGIGPIRNDSYRQKRSAPYPPGGDMDGSVIGNSNDSSKFSGRRGRGGRFGGNQRESFNNSTPSNNFIGGRNQFDSWNHGGGNGGNNEVQNAGGRRYNESNNFMGFNGNISSSSSSNFTGYANKSGQQDRRGFALPSTHQPQAPLQKQQQQHQQQQQHHQQQQRFGGNRGGFVGSSGNSPSVANNIFQYSAPNMNKTLGRGGIRGGFMGNRGGSNATGFREGAFKRDPSTNNNSTNNYNQQFPPLGASSYSGRGGGGSRGGINRNMPRQNMMSNRRY